MDTVERIKAICKERGIAISRLERECGFSNGYIRGLREGQMPSNRLFKVAEYLELSPDYLVTGKETPKESTSGKVYYFNDETAEIAQDIYGNPDLHWLHKNTRKMPPEDLAALKTMVSALIRKEKGEDG